MQLTFSEKEQQFLLEALELRQRELLNEIAHTDRREFRQELRRNEELLESLLDRLRGAAVSGF